MLTNTSWREFTLNLLLQASKEMKKALDNRFMLSNGKYAVNINHWATNIFGT